MSARNREKRVRTRAEKAAAAHPVFGVEPEEGWLRHPVTGEPMPGRRLRDPDDDRPPSCLQYTPSWAEDDDHDWHEGARKPGDRLADILKDAQ